MAEDRPAWRQGFDAVESAVAPRLEGLMGSEGFQVALGLVARVQKELQRQAERTMRRTLHLWNLPAGSDVIRILNEIGKLRAELRALAKEVDAGKGVWNGTAGRDSGSPRSGATRP